MMEVGLARSLAEGHLAGALPRRWGHVEGVAKRAEELASVLDVDERVLVAAAWLHDIGYAPDLVETVALLKRPASGHLGRTGRVRSEERSLVLASQAGHDR